MKNSASDVLRGAMVYHSGHMDDATNMTGQRFGRLTLMGPQRHHRSGRPGWRACCDCGNEVVIRANDLISERVRSCGCLRSALRTQNNMKHGACGTPEYNAWQLMRDRCYNPHNKAFRYYGGRGIRVHPRWGAFEAFLEDMGPRPSPQHSLDRFPNGDGNYEPGNVRWVNRTEQARNKRNNRLLTCSGKTATLAEWAEISGVGESTIRARLRKGWPIEEALKPPATGLLAEAQ